MQWQQSFDIPLPRTDGIPENRREPVQLNQAPLSSNLGEQDEFSRGWQRLLQIQLALESLRHPLTFSEGLRREIQARLLERRWLQVRALMRQREQIPESGSDPSAFRPPIVT